MPFLLLIQSVIYVVVTLDGSYGDPETILDQNELKERYNYVSIPRIKISPSGRVSIVFMINVLIIYLTN